MAVGPFVRGCPASRLQPQPCLSGRVFVAVFRVDGVASTQREPLARNLERQIAPRLQMHLYPAQGRVPAGRMPETVSRDIRIEFAIDAMQQVQVELWGDPLPVVIGLEQHIGFLQPVETDQQPRVPAKG